MAQGTTAINQALDSFEANNKKAAEAAFLLVPIFEPMPFNFPLRHITERSNQARQRHRSEQQHQQQRIDSMWILRSSKLRTSCYRASAPHLITRLLL